VEAKFIQRAIAKACEPLKRRVMQMVGRCVLTAAADDSEGIQKLQVSILSGETLDGIQRMQEYGFTSVPNVGAEGIVLSLSGNRDHSVCVATEDRRFRIKNLEEGEVAIYTDEGDVIEFKRGNLINIKASEAVSIETKTANVTASTEAVIEAPAVKLGASAAEAVIKGNTFQSLFNAHTHNGNLGAPTGPPIVPLNGSELSTKVKTE
jgi:phage baseplate assembly protein V